MARPLRYTVIVALTALATVLAALGGWRYARASAPLNGPIILISIDTLRADHLPAYGYRQIRTPSIDALAADGVVFERAYGHVPQTLPAHVALLSGRLPFETGIRDDDDVVKDVRLLPQLLHDRGYATAGIVSCAVLSRDAAFARAFDFFDGVRRTDATEGQRDGAKSEEIAERWLDTAGTARLFLFLHLNEPHRPYHLPEGFASPSSYDAEIVSADEIVGKLLKYLKSHQLYDRSTIVLLSDHGEGLGDHGEQEHGLFLYDEAIHVPLIVKQAPGVGIGRRVPDVVQHIDILPTMLDLVKAPTPGGLRGRSLTPLLDGTGSLSARPVYGESLYGSRHFHWSPIFSVTDRQYRYIRAPRDETYDLRADPRERRNIAADRPADRQALKAALDRFGTKVRPSDIQIETDLADPKDTVETLETYREAASLAAARKWTQAIRLLQGTVNVDSGAYDVWMLLAACSMRIGRFEQAADAYARAADLQPMKVDPEFGAAQALLKLRRYDEARDRVEHAISVAAKGDRFASGAGHELLARIALAARDPDGARAEAALATQADRSRPVASFIDGRLAYEQGDYEQALAAFDEAIAAVTRAAGRPLSELRFYAADTLVRLDRADDAEPHYIAELRDFPDNTRASTALASLYHTRGRDEEAREVLIRMLEVNPTPDAYAAASRLLRTFGDSREADAIRAEGRRLLFESGGKSGG